MPSAPLYSQLPAFFEAPYFLPLDSLRDYAFCPRLFGLVYIEGLQAPASPAAVHSAVNAPPAEKAGFAVELPLCSKTLELCGVASRVEFYPDERGAKLEGREGRWMPAATFFQAGKQKAEPFERIYLCAVTLCLEEMFGVHIDYAVYYQAAASHRELIKIDSILRENTIRLSRELRGIWQSRKVASFCCASKAKCLRCPLKSLCLPELNASPRVQDYINNALKHK